MKLKSQRNWEIKWLLTETCLRSKCSGTRPRQISRRVKASPFSLASSATLVSEGELRMAFNGLKLDLEYKRALFEYKICDWSREKPVRVGFEYKTACETCGSCWVAEIIGAIIGSLWFPLTA